MFKKLVPENWNEKMNGNQFSGNVSSARATA